ncbi:MAG: hypothetical protein AB7L91_01645 [Dehalococcoidia bacterium]
MAPLLHLVVATFRSHVDPPMRTSSIEQGRDLITAPGVEAQVLGWSERQLVVGTVLGSTIDLDAFVASPEHMRFVMRGLAPVISGMWSTAIETASTPAVEDGAAVWVFALSDQEGIYEWQVRQFLDEAAQLGTAAVGVTVEERERFRAGGLISFGGMDLSDIERLVAAARQRWAEAGGDMEDAIVRTPSAAPR